MVVPMSKGKERPTKDDLEQLGEALQKMTERQQQEWQQATEFKAGELTPEEEQFVKREGLNALNYIPQSTLQEHAESPRTSQKERAQPDPRHKLSERNRGVAYVLKKAFGITVWVLVIGFSLWLLGIFVDAYRAHTWGFIALWFMLPIFAYYITHAAVEGNPSAARSLNVSFVAASILLSFATLFDYDQVRDSIGEHYVSGYIALRGDVEYGENGQPYRPTDVYTDHWYSKFALWLLEWFFLAACVGLPILTHKAVRRGARNALDGP